MTQQDYRREYKRRFALVARAKAKGFDAHKAALVALKLIEYGLTAAEVRQGLYLAACDGAFGNIKRR